LNIDHVCDKGEALELQPRDVSLQQDIDLGGRFLHALLDGDRYTLQQLAQLKLLLLTDREELELLRESEDTEQLDGSHSGSEVLVVSGHGIVRHVEVGSDASKVGALELARGSLILDKVAFLKESGGGVDDISALLNEGTIVILVIDADTVQDGVLEHAHIPTKHSTM